MSARTCAECLGDVDADDLTLGDCPGGSGEKCDECNSCACDGSC